MKINFANIDMQDRPILILKRADGTPIGVLGNAVNVELNPKYNELSILTFTLPAYVDGVSSPYYEDLTGHKIIELRGIAQFIVSNPGESGDKLTLKKQVTANSLECEFARKKITLPESTYKFYDSLHPDGTVLGMIMELMPNWSVGSVSSSLYTKYRTFDVSGENLYNFIKGTVQTAYNCIFDFDTLARTVSVRDADETPAQKQVFISRDNLAKDIEVTENTDDIVTRLEVKGADGVDIREVNPTGTNYLLNLDYFAGTGCFDASLTNKYNAWKQLVESNRRPFYNYAIQYAMYVSEELAEQAKLKDLQGEYTSLENIQAVIIQGIASGLKAQSDLDTANSDLDAKQAEIDAKQAEIEQIITNKTTTLGYMQNIRDACAYENYFTATERKALDVYIFDNGIVEDSFVASEVQSYTDGAGNAIENKTVVVTGATVETTVTAARSTLYSLSGGTVNVASGMITGTVISSVFESRLNGKVVLSLYLSNGTYNGVSFPSGCVSISGAGSVAESGQRVACDITEGYLFFSLNASDYEKKTVSWDLYEYGNSLLNKMSIPAYSFSVDSANFIAMEPFQLFKNELELGQRIYIQIAENRILQPVCIGAAIRFGDKPYLAMEFSDTFTATDSASKLADILDNSVSMGKTLSAGRFTYEAWTGSGASSELRGFITSALDTAKNAIMSSSEQAVTWDGAGFRMRQYSNDSHTSYEPEQIWMNNNSILMTDDGWSTAKMAIGKIHDENVGDKWGIIADMLVGTLLAGEELVIESEKKSGGTSVFRMDSEGCRLYNSEFTIQKTNTNGTTTQVLLDPDVGIAMGTYPVLNANGTINTDNAKFYVDASGNMHLAGSIKSADGEIGGWTISPTGLYSGSGSTYVGMSSSGDYRIWAGDAAAADAPFSVQQDGTMTSKKGQIGGWYIGTDYLGNANTKANSTVGLASGTTTGTVSIWAGGTQSAAPFRVTVDGAVTASNMTITGGSITIKDDNDNVAFNVTNKGAVTGTNMTITGGSITIKDGNTTKFQVTNTGKVTISDGSITIKNSGTTTFSVSDTGTLTAISGQVGNWYISSEHIGNASTRANSTVGMVKSTTSTDKVFWAGGKPDASTAPPFYVTQNGNLYANNIHVTGGELTIGGQSIFSVTTQGSLTAAKGSVGGWNIGTDFIGNTSSLSNSTVGLSSSTTSGDIVMWAGGVRANAKFSVTAGGKLSATGASISGAINATSLKCGNTTITDLGIYLTDSDAQNTYALKADLSSFTSTYSSKIGTLETKTQYIQDNGKFQFTATNFTSIGTSSSAVYITPTQVKISSTGTFLLDSSNFHITSNSVYIGSLSSVQDQNTGVYIGTSGIRINNGSVPFIATGGDGQFGILRVNGSAAFIGPSSGSSAYFSADSNGNVYITKLYLWDATNRTWVSPTFSSSTSGTTSPGTWSGNVFTTGRSGERLTCTLAQDGSKIYLYVGGNKISGVSMDAPSSGGGSHSPYLSVGSGSNNTNDFWLSVSAKCGSASTAYTIHIAYSGGLIYADIAGYQYTIVTS